MEILILSCIIYYLSADQLCSRQLEMTVHWQNLHMFVVCVKSSRKHCCFTSSYSSALLIESSCLGHLCKTT